jgi:hypothetical protein
LKNGGPSILLLFACSHGRNAHFEDIAGWGGYEIALEIS